MSPKITWDDSMRSRPTLTIPEAASVLSISPETAYRWAREGRLPGAIRLGPSAVRVRTDVLLALVLGERGAARNDNDPAPTGSKSTT